MISYVQTDGALVPQLRHPHPAAPGLERLTARVRTAVNKRADWRDTAQLVASELERNLPSPTVLDAEQRIGDPDAYRSHVLHSEPDGGFSIVALVWRPGQVTPIHDHVTCYDLPIAPPSSAA